MLRLMTTIGIILAALTSAFGQNESRPDVTVAAVRFKFREVRGRQTLHTSSGRYEGELSLEMQGTSRVLGMKNYGDSHRSRQR